MRHGETAWSKNGRHTSHTDLPLTEKGRNQAMQIGRRLTGRRFARVLTSPMRRARDTCELAGFGALAQVDRDLLEWNYGDYEGITTEEIRKTVPGWTVWTHPCPNGESPKR